MSAAELCVIFNRRREGPGRPASATPAPAVGSNEAMPGLLKRGLKQLHDLLQGWE